MPTINQHSTLADTAVNAYGSLQSWFDLALLNGVSITEVLAAGTQLQGLTGTYREDAVVLPAPSPAPRRYLLPKHSTLVDVVVQQNNTVEAWFELAQLNGVSITDEVAAGSQLQVSDVQLPVREIVFAAPAVRPTQQLLLQQQTLADYTTQFAGSIEAWFELAQLNEVSITADLQPGLALQAPVLDRQVVRFFNNSIFDVVSLLPTRVVRPGGIGFMQIGNDFKVS